MSLDLKVIVTNIIRSSSVFGVQGFEFRLSGSGFGRSPVHVNMKRCLRDA